jgi:hypothetical protein
MNENHYFYDAAFLGINMIGKMFVGIIPSKSSRNFTRPLGNPRGLKSLLHTLNAIVHPTKEGFILLFFSFISCFVMLRD